MALTDDQRALLAEATMASLPFVRLWLAKEILCAMLTNLGMDPESQAVAAKTAVQTADVLLHACLVKDAKA